MTSARLSVRATRTDRQAAPRVVVNLVGDAAHGQLAESRFVERTFLPGGEHNMYELAFAAAALGYDVELRGWLDRPAFERLAGDAGTRPSVELPARSPGADDLVVVPEGWRDPVEYGRLALSPARTALYLLAAPGLFGWPFVAEPWVAPDPLTVPLEELGRPEHFQGMAGLGFALLTHSPGIVAAAREAGVACALVGTGHPGWSAPPARDKTVDVAAILDNRWAPLAERVLGELEGVAIDRIETVGNEALVERLARARVLLWPSRIEGHATIPWEARTAGCVPVALSSNRFGVGLDEAHGTVLVDDLAGLAPAVRGLLADGPGWEEMSRRGRDTAPAQVDWSAYVARVREFLSAPAQPDPGRAPRAGIGSALAAWSDRRAAEAQARLEELTAELEVAGRDLTAATRNQEELLAEIASLHSRRSVQVALRIADALKARGS